MSRSAAVLSTSPLPLQQDSVGPWYPRWFRLPRPIRPMSRRSGTAERPRTALDGPGTPPSTHTPRPLAPVGLGPALRTRERCNRCGGRFEASDDAVAPVLGCRDCRREVPARALRPRPSRWRERLLLAVAVAIPASLAVAVAFGFPDPDAGSPPLRLRVDGELIRAQVWRGCASTTARGCAASSPTRRADGTDPEPPLDELLVERFDPPPRRPARVGDPLPARHVAPWARAAAQARLARRRGIDVRNDVRVIELRIAAIVRKATRQDAA
jgi:hypothetical protein